MAEERKSNSVQVIDPAKGRGGLSIYAGMFPLTLPWKMIKNGSSFMAPHGLAHAALKHGLFAESNGIPWPAWTAGDVCPGNGIPLGHPDPQSGWTDNRVENLVFLVTDGLHVQAVNKFRYLRQVDLALRGCDRLLRCPVTSNAVTVETRAFCQAIVAGVIHF